MSIRSLTIVLVFGFYVATSAEVNAVGIQVHDSVESALLTPTAAAKRLESNKELRSDHFPRDDRPNILFISIDDLNDWVGCLGGHPQSQTPNIDKLAGRGVLFSNAHCQAPVCNPSRASMLTGRYPHSTGVYFLSPDLRSAPSLRDVRTLPEVFAAADYHTLAAGKIFHGGDQRFFQEYGGPFGGFGPRPPEKISQPHGHPLWDWGAFPKTDQQMPDIRIANWATEKLQQSFEKPFFMAVGFYRPHVPMFVPKKWFDMHPIESIELPQVLQTDREDLSQYALDLTNLHHVSPTHQWMTSSGQWQHAVQAYLASSTFVDHCVGKVLSALQASEYSHNTIVVLFSDHGFHLGEKQRWAKRTLWEDSTHVPLVISSPGVAGGFQSDEPVELLDIFPTLLQLAGLPADSGQQGKSLVPLMNQQPVSNWRPAITSFGPGNFSIRNKRFRLIRYRDGSVELYDHQSDPHEWFNIADHKSSQVVVRELEKYIPMQPAILLPGDSTGHKAFAASNERSSKK